MLEAAARFEFFVAPHGVVESVKLDFAHACFQGPLNCHVKADCGLICNRHALQFKRKLHKFEEGKRLFLFEVCPAIQQSCINSTNLLSVQRFDLSLALFDQKILESTIGLADYTRYKRFVAVTLSE